MAKSTVANSPDPHQLCAGIVRPFACPNSPRPQPDFRVFSTGEAEYHWRIAAITTNRTISRHKSLGFALRKCTRLNEVHGEGARHETN